MQHQAAHGQGAPWIYEDRMVDRFLYLAQYHRLLPRSCSIWGWGWTALPPWPALRSDHQPLWKLPRHGLLKRDREYQHVNLLVIRSWLPKGPGSGIPKDAGRNTSWDSGSNQRLRNTRGFLSIIVPQLNLHTTASLLYQGPVFRNTTCSLPLAEQLLLVTWTTEINLICLLAAYSVATQSMFPVLTRSGSLVSHFSYTLYVKLRTRKHDGLVLHNCPLLTRQERTCNFWNAQVFPPVAWRAWVSGDIYESTTRQVRLECRSAFSRRHPVPVFPS